MRAMLSAREPMGRSARVRRLLRKTLVPWLPHRGLATGVRLRSEPLSIAITNAVFVTFIGNIDDTKASSPAGFEVSYYRQQTFIPGRYLSISKLTKSPTMHLAIYTAGS